jgi:RNA polymerase sigma-70 factor (ECF subfamily)
METGLSQASRMEHARRGEDERIRPKIAQESELLEALRKEDEAAFETLVRTHAGRLLAVARRLLHNEEDARDIVQEAFLSAFRALPSFLGASTLSTWLHRIVVNAALMKIRGGSRHSEESIEELLPRFDATGHHIGAVGQWFPPPDAGVLRRETREQIRAAIEGLPVNYRVVVILRDIQGLSTEETAKVLSVSSTAVKLRLHRARLALRTLLAPVFERPGRLARCAGQA